LKKAGNGVYAFVIDGSISISENTLFKRDALGVWDVDSIDIKADTDAEVLLIEVPMNEEE
jgi:redox-sensitive bicupin YhaK (pirin superfamily)